MKIKKQRIKNFWMVGVVVFVSLIPAPAVFADDDPPQASEKEAPPAVPQPELDKLKGEWEAVREQQIQMIREKQEQLEKLKEEIFSKMKSVNAPDASALAVSQPETTELSAPVLPAKNAPAEVSGDSEELEAQKTALQAERQKFFAEMNRQKESLRKLQSALDEKTKQLEADRENFEKKKKAIAA